MTILEGQGLKHIASQSDGPGCRYQMQRPGPSFQGRVLDKSSKDVFQAMARLLVEAEKTNDGSRENQRWQLDLIDFSKRISKLNRQSKYVLIAVDLYNRQAFTQIMPQKTARATLEAFRKLIRKNDGEMPKEITVDLGLEYAMLEQEITDKGGVLRWHILADLTTCSQL